VKKTLILSILAGGMFMFSACDEKKPDAPAAPAAPEKKAEPAAPAAAPTPAAPAAPAAGAADTGGDVGVAECDDYIKQYSACLGKMPAAAKTAAENAFKASKDAWKQAASTPAGKDGLKTACKAALDAMKSNPMCK
jgi:Meckel syndrome type 1 protein